MQFDKNWKQPLPLTFQRLIMFTFSSWFSPVFLLWKYCTHHDLSPLTTFSTYGLYKDLIMIFAEWELHSPKEDQALHCRAFSTWQDRGSAIYWSCLGHNGELNICSSSNPGWLNLKMIWVGIRRGNPVSLPIINSMSKTFRLYLQNLLCHTFPGTDTICRVPQAAAAVIER